MRVRVAAAFTTAAARRVAGAVLLIGVAGCGAPTVPPEASGTLEELAVKAGCEPRIGTEAAELRQADCRTDLGTYVLATFATDRGRQEWLDAANDYGGSYLVGRKWVAVGEQGVLTALRGRLGGTVETAVGHSGSGERPTGGAVHTEHHAS
ncbi:hypothetical protein [Streptomyces sp. NPDC051561]|uniref:hypothetical protein n=1 Tax=Streptomyces sp. NPDC051561 TaxID=3365658 RepID=UPI003793B627